MGTSLKDKSRMSLTLQGYDQVIALSQANINQSLKYHFRVNRPQLRRFNVVMGKAEDPDNWLNGDIDVPTVELVDADKADHALYTLTFQAGAQYFYWARVQGSRQLEPIKVSAAGWKIAFFVNFAMSKAAEMPEAVRNVVNKAGSYSVDQLVIVFGTADLLTFDWARSKITGMDHDQSAKLDLQAVMSQFVDRWLMSLKSAEGGQSHNILGYSVKLDVEGDSSRDQLIKRMGNVSPHFTPTAVQFQIIANKDNATSTGDVADPYNAFLFTEMTNLGIFPNNDLQWSGKWFYDTIGGTLAMSNRIFLKGFVGDLINDKHDLGTTWALPLAKRQSWDANVRLARTSTAQFLAPWTRNEWVAEGNKWKLESVSHTTHPTIMWLDRDLNDGKEFAIRLEIDASMSTCLVPFAASGRLEIQHSIKIVTKWGNQGAYNFDCTTIVPWKYVVSLDSIGSQGDLNATVTYEKGTPSMVSSISDKGRVLMGKDSSMSAEESVKWSTYEDLLKSTIVARMVDTSGVAHAIQEGLNGQKQFIFPGGGTFDMKDPIFSDAGDILIGLVYKQGKL